MRDDIENIVDLLIPNKEEKDMRWEMRSRLVAFRNTTHNDAIKKAMEAVPPLIEVSEYHPGAEDAEEINKWITSLSERLSVMLIK